MCAIFFIRIYCRDDCIIGFGGGEARIWPAGGRRGSAAEPLTGVSQASSGGWDSSGPGQAGGCLGRKGMARNIYTLGYILAIVKIDFDLVGGIWQSAHWHRLKEVPALKNIGRIKANIRFDVLRGENNHPERRSVTIHRANLKTVGGRIAITMLQMLTLNFNILFSGLPGKVRCGKSFRIPRDGRKAPLGSTQQ